MTRIVLVANSAWYLFNFRLALLQKLKREGFALLLLSPEDPYAHRLLELGFDWRPLPMSRGSVKIQQLWREFKALRKFYSEFGPHLAHHFTWKPVVLGTLAALSLGGIGTVNSVTGLGHMFLSRRPSAWLARRILPCLLRFYERMGAQFVFQNRNDLDFAGTQWGLNATVLIPGSGVDLARFARSESANESKQGVIGLFASRLLRQKGLDELIEAFQLVRPSHSSFQLWLAGGIDKENPSGYSEAEVRRWESIPGLRWLGHLDPIDPVFSEVDFLVLPSWREGLSKILLEGGAAGLPAITTRVPGCEDVVLHETTGLTVPVQNCHALAEALKRMIRSPEQRKEWGAAARKRVAQEFSDTKVNERTIDVYRSLIKSPAPAPSG
jgi:glycosyltransferase involved in cell wall biosynthesis